MGTSAARIAPSAAFAELDGPGPARVDDELGEQLDERLAAWAQQTGIYADRMEHFRACRYGRLVMLTHPDTDDVERLMLAARWMAALFAVDDYYCDDRHAGAVLEKVGPRLTLAVSALDRPHLVGEYAERLAEALRSDPVLVALHSALGEIARCASAAQLSRIRHETAAMFVVMNAEAAWRYTGGSPAVWEFLASRQPNSFLPCMTLIDVVGGYEVPADVYGDPRTRRATGLAASATVIVNDLYSTAKVGDFNLPTLIAAERGCSLREATDITIGIHNQVVRAFEDTRRELMATPCPQLARYLLGLRAWMGGSREWHRSSVRYQT